MGVGWVGLGDVDNNKTLVVINPSTAKQITCYSGIHAKNLKSVIKSFVWFYPPGGKQLGMARPPEASGMFRNLPGAVGGG